MYQALLEIMEPEINKIAAKATAEATKRADKETAENMLKGGKLSVEEIRQYIPRLSVEEIKTIAKGLTQR